MIEFIPFPRVLVLCEMQSVSSRIWTRVAVSIFYDDNHFTTGTSINFCDGWQVAVLLLFCGVLPPWLVQYCSQYSCVVTVKLFLYRCILSIMSAISYLWSMFYNSLAWIGTWISEKNHTQTLINYHLLHHNNNAISCLSCWTVFI